MSKTINAKSEKFGIALEYVRSEQERRAIRKAILRIHARHNVRLIASNGERV